MQGELCANSAQKRLSHTSHHDELPLERRKENNFLQLVHKKKRIQIFKKQRFRPAVVLSIKAE